MVQAAASPWAPAQRQELGPGAGACAGSSAGMRRANSSAAPRRAALARRRGAERRQGKAGVQEGERTEQSKGDGKEIIV